VALLVAGGAAVPLMPGERASGLLIQRKLDAGRSGQAGGEGGFTSFFAEVHTICARMPARAWAAGHDFSRCFKERAG